MPYQKNEEDMVLVVFMMTEKSWCMRSAVSYGTSMVWRYGYPFWNARQVSLHNKFALAKTFPFLWCCYPATVLVLSWWFNDRKRNGRYGIVLLCFFFDSQNPMPIAGSFASWVWTENFLRCRQQGEGKVRARWMRDWLVCSLLHNGQYGCVIKNAMLFLLQYIATVLQRTENTS